MPPTGRWNMGVLHVGLRYVSHCNTMWQLCLFPFSNWTRNILSPCGCTLSMDVTPKSMTNRRMWWLHIFQPLFFSPATLWSFSSMTWNCTWLQKGSEGHLNGCRLPRMAQWFQKMIACLCWHSVVELLIEFVQPAEMWDFMHSHLSQGY